MAKKHVPAQRYGSETKYERPPNTDFHFEAGLPAKKSNWKAVIELDDYKGMPKCIDTTKTYL